MRKQYWTIIAPDGELYLKRIWDTEKEAGEYLEDCSGEKTLDALKKDGWKIVDIWMERGMV